MKFWFALLFLAMLNIMPAQAQSPMVTATVNVNVLNVRYAPNAYWGNTKIGQLHRGDVIEVQQYEQIDAWNWSYENITWVYMYHPASGLTGWVSSTYLTFSNADWREVLPSINTWDDLGREVVQQIGTPIETTVNGNGGEIVLWSEPTSDSPRLGTIPPDETVLVLGAARINGTISAYIYVDYPALGIKGWIDSFWTDFPIIHSGSNYDGWISALPVVYERDFYAEYAQFPIAVRQVYEVNIRESPSLDASIIFTTTRYSRSTREVAVHGRTNHDFEGWAYITFLDSGISGWMYDPADNSFLVYANGVSRESLPILQP